MEKKNSKKKALLAASIAGLIAVAGAVLPASVAYAEDVKCSGVNACKGNGDCGGAGSSCAGSNACKGQGWISVSEKACKQLGGTVA